MGLSMDDGVHRVTILDLSYACLQVVQSQVADLVFETIEIHCDGSCVKGYFDVSGQRKVGIKKGPLHHSRFD